LDSYLNINVYLAVFFREYRPVNKRKSKATDKGKTMTIYTMKHSEINFSSVNEKQVEYYEKLLSGITQKDLKDNTFEGRHGLLMNMSLAGDSPLTFDYLRARGIKEEYKRKFVSSFDKYTTTVVYNNSTMLIWDAAEKYAIDQTKDYTGWTV
tara:strand:- start:3735 stop:4190 length:456 start_codon:yes stop_codon:yes gene_type:complete